MTAAGTAAPCPRMATLTLDQVLSREALRFGEERHDLADIVLVTMLSGTWQRLVARVARSLAVRAVRGERLTGEELRRLLTEFRYRHHLIAAADLESWMSRRSLRLADLEGVLERNWLADRYPDAPISPVASEQVVAVIWAEARLAGIMEAGQDTLVAWHAGFDWVAAVELASSSRWAPACDQGRVAETTELALRDPVGGLRLLGRSDVFRRVMRLLSLQAGYERFRAHAVTDKAVDARIAQHRLDWTTVEGWELSFELEGAARETRLQVVCDGKALGEIGATLGVEPVSRRLEIGSAPSGISAVLLAARDGDLVGPWKEDGRWRVLQLVSRRDPESAADEALRSRARDELLAEMVERLAAGKAVRDESL